MILKKISEQRFGRKRHREAKVRILTPSTNRTTGTFANHGNHTALLPPVHNSKLVSSRLSPTMKQPPKMGVALPSMPTASATATTSASPSKNSVNVNRNIITEDADSPTVLRCPSPTSVAQLPDPSIRIEYEEALIIVTPNKENQIHDTNNEHELNKKRDRVVSFQDHVTVLEIPSHRDYSPAEHKNIWSTASERKESRRRNVREFQADQRDWRRCKEDHEMVYLDGELVHPHTYLQVTGKQARSKNRVRVSNPKLKRREYVAVKAKNAATFNKAKLGATRRKTLTAATRRRGATQGGQYPLQQCHKRILPIRKGSQ